MASIDRSAGCTVDHIVPLARGGRRHSSNEVPCCRRCNELKDSLTAEEFRAAFDMTKLPEWAGLQRVQRRGVSVLPSSRWLKQKKRQAEAEIALKHAIVTEAARARAGRRAEDMGLTGAATATLGEILAAKQK